MKGGRDGLWARLEVRKKVEGWEQKEGGGGYIRYVAWRTYLSIVIQFTHNQTAFPCLYTRLD